MTEDSKELVKRLRAQGQKNYGLSADAAAAIEALAGEVERLKMEAKTATTLLEAEKWSRAHVRPIIVSSLETERDRLKAALGAIAVKAGTSECGGNYVAAISLIGDLEQMADAALRAAGDGR